MNILGYVGYAVLIFLAATWTLGVRIKLGINMYTIFGALFFLASALIIGISGVNKLHSLWLIPSGYILPQVISKLAIHISPLFHLIKLLSSGFAMIIRIGVPTSKIKAAQDAASRATVESYISRMDKDDK
jgi:hypothetical protein